MTIGWHFDNTYSKLPDAFREIVKPIPVKSPELILLNKNLANELNLNFNDLSNKEISELFSGNSLPKNSVSIAQAYVISIWAFYNAGRRKSYFNWRTSIKK